MAEGRSGSSPREDFNPLSEEQFSENYQQQAANGDDSWQEDLQSQKGSDEDGSASDVDEGRLLGQQYSITPPSIPRVRIREKGKGRHLDRSYKEFLINKRQQQPKTGMNVIKNEYLTDPALCNLIEFDSDDNLDKDLIREKKEKKKKDTKEMKKTLSKIRLNDRQEKRLSEDFGMLHVSDPLDQSHIPVKLEGSGRFSHLRTKPIPLISPESRVRRQIADAPTCPRAREDFHTNFSLLIKLGTELKKDKENNLATYRNVFDELIKQRTALIERIWLELQAYLNNKISPDEQIEILKNERQVHDQVIDEINKFCFADTISEECGDSSISVDSSSAAVFFSGNPQDKSYRELVSRSVSASFSDVNLNNDVVCLQVKALSQVQRLLEKLDHYESCFDTTKACGKENKKYMDPGFQRRVKCLNLWLNITCDLCQKLKLFGRIIGAHSRGISWPLINFEFPKPQPHEFHACQRASIPNVMETEPTDCSDVEEVEEGECNDQIASIAESEDKNFLTPCRKQVKFQFGDESNSDQGSPTGSPGSHDPLNPLDSSTPLKGPSASANTTAPSYSSVLGVSHTSSDALFENSRSCNASVYRHYAEKCLRKMGLQRLNVRLRDLFHRSLRRAKEALQRPKDTPYSDMISEDQHKVEVEDSEEYSSIPSSGPMSGDVYSRPNLLRGSSLSEHGEWSTQFIEMGLPSFRPTYLYIVRIQLDVIHECLKLRKDQRPMGDPSFLSIRQLIRECKEVLKGATLVKQYYHYMVDAVMWDEHEAEAKFETDLTEFDEDMKSMLDVYFNYLQNWIYMLQGLPQASLGMKSALEEEWGFTKTICAFIMRGEAEAAKKFSSLASSLLSSIADFLDNGIDEITRNLYDEAIDDDDDDLEEDEEENDEDYEDENGSLESKSKARKMAEMKQNVQNILRNFKILFNEARERSSKALGFAKLLRKDLEVAADYNITVTTKELFTKLMDTRHVQLCAPLSSGYMMFVPEKIISNRELVLQLLNVTCGREDNPDPARHVDLSNSSHASSVAKEDGYLLMMRCENGLEHIKECPRWTGFKMQVEPTAETAIAISHIEVMGLLFVVANSGNLATQRKHFENTMGKTIQLVNEQTSCHQSIAESLSELKTNALELMVKVGQAIKQVNEKLNFNEVIQHEESILKLYRETMLKMYDFGFEYQRELMRLISRDQREKMCQMTVSFAQDWMTFVIDKCERGRGTRPRWATQGLEFIALACEPKNIVYLTNEEFENFQHNIHNALSHIIGTLDNRSVGQGLSLSRSNLDLSRSNQPLMQRLTSCPETRILRSVSSRSVQSEPSNSHLSTSGLTPTPGVSNSKFFGDNRGTRYSIPELPEISIVDSADGRIYLDIGQTRRGSRGINDMYGQKSRSEQLQKAIEKLEQDRENKLRDNRIIGHVTTRVHEPDYRMNVKRVNFRWQRGIKIGEGQFGKVYTAVNINTGELMAMKEMKFQPNDQQSLKESCDEIKNFEGINHKNLVKYYGVEVHKDEMLMFMEYCDSGSIEEVARIGLPEYMIRRYTNEIVQAIAHLHENNIVHRDIKGANIFLTSQGHVKLGDFGCSVKLKNQQTMPGENINLVGTTAYMAPEVITQNKQEGYGRAADIWSLGCVVIEMATGKRPWHELEHNLQVMFKVGTGHTPPIPDCLSKEGKSFLGRCLVHEPSLRATAAELLDHMFVKCYDDVEENDSDENS